MNLCLKDFAKDLLDKNPRKVILSVCIVFMAMIMGPAQAIGQEEYSYFDDFSTDRAMSDSYEHSGFFETPPYSSFTGYLMYMPLPIYGRFLGFFRGFEPPPIGDAHLYYRFPLEDGLGDVMGGSVSFDLSMFGGDFSFLTSFNGIDWSPVDTNMVGGHHSYEISPPDSCRYIFIHLTGSGVYPQAVLLDNLTVSLIMDSLSSNNPPFIPSSPSPQDGMDSVSTDVTISWHGGDPDPNDTVRYDIYFGQHLAPLLLQSNWPDTLYHLPLLQNNSNYFWMIISKDHNNSSSISPIWSFTTVRGACTYVPGDINGNGTSNGVDIVCGVNYLKGTGNPPPVDCGGICPEPSPFYAAGDVNGNCAFNGIDITFFVRFLKGQVPSLLYCPDCPPADVVVRGNIPVITPSLMPAKIGVAKEQE